jgi:glyoxylase-like metal-dependent hydrolase (beta-lactamase superfamily II)
MINWKTSSGIEIFQVLNQRSNSYLICSGSENLLVDTGGVSAYNQLQRNIYALNIKPEDISLLILTHTHFDHCQNAYTIKQQTNCKIIMSEKEAIYSKPGFTPLPKGTLALTRLISNLGTLIGRKGFGYKPFTPDVLITGDLNLSPSKITLISTGGHSKGSISIIVDDEIAIVGDAMFGVFRKSIFTPFADNVNDMTDSWGRLLKTGCNTFLPGHGHEIKRELLQTEYEKYSQRRNINNT